MPAQSDLLQPGRAWPLGAHFDGHGVNFAVFSAHAQRIELCLYDAQGREEGQRTALPGHTRDVFHGYLPGAQPGLVYALRAHGPWRPDHGHRFDASLALIDPWGRELVGGFGHTGAATTPRTRLVHDDFDWQDDQRPSHAADDFWLYELHIKGFSQLNPAVPEPLRGSYAGLAHPASIAHLQRLGVRAVSLMPVHQHLDEHRLVQRGLVNYWGYNTIGFFCPEPRLASVFAGLDPQARDAALRDAATMRAVRDEFRAMVLALHRAGIEVILDVVFNHTGESDETGPTLCWRGLDNASWYRLPHDRPETYVNHSGCGNTLDIRQPRVLQFVMDCLRYWVGEMHVDGFRFDLAPVLARGDHGFDAHAALFRAIAQDPQMAGARLIAEPWDLGPEGYQLGSFPHGWLEWNDRFRDTMRRWWLHGHVARGEFARRLCASADVFHRRHRLPADSVNFIAAHDGFTLRDLVSFQHRHNHANGEDNRDGHAHNHSHNLGVEGDPAPEAVRQLRRRLCRAMLATVFLSQGTPMLCAGDELGRTQRGNNNAYCQDNPISWLDWSQADATMIDFVAHLSRLRSAHLPLANHWYTGVPDRQGQRDLAWLDAKGLPLEGDAWDRPDGRTLGALIRQPGRVSGEASVLLMLVNGDASDSRFVLPPGRWWPLLDSSQEDGVPLAEEACEGELPMPAHALLLLHQAPL